MLTLTHLKSPSDKLDVLDTFDANRATWVVSDLRNKFEIQKLILENQDSYEDLSVLRASELWRILLRRSHPEMKFVSSELISTWVKEETKRDSNLKLGNSAHQTVVEMMDVMASVHCHDLGADRLRDWFRENPESLQRWGGWFLLSEKYCHELLEQNKIAAKWSAAFLQNEFEWKSFWDRPLIFDLGSQISQVEADLIRAIARDIDVWVLAPTPEWKNEFAYLLKPYDFLEAQADQKRKVPETALSPSKDPSNALRFSGVLGETKKAVESVREWLEQGVAAENIALIAPDMEKYWPLLQPLLLAEGIPSNKDLMSRLQILPSVSQWLSQLRLGAQDVKYSDLESALYVTDDPSGLRFEEFYSLFAELMGSEDLRRHALIEKSFQSQFSLNDEISRDEWLGFSARCWKSKASLEPIEICFREILTNTDAGMKMRVSSWIHLLEQIVAKKEIRIKKGDRSGIQLANLSAGDSISITHRIFLGLTESMLKTTASPMLTPKEVMMISNELGFALEHPEVSSLEFDLAWLSENQNVNSLYFYPQTGFSGGAETPTALWLKKSDENSQKLSHPVRLRWDSILELEKMEIETAEDDRLTLKTPVPLSPSSIESYRKCAFTFASQKLFRLQDLPVMDFDVDRRTRGSLAHALLEQLGAEPRKFEWSQAELETMIDGLREKAGLGKMDEFIWRGLKDRHVKLAQRFNLFEKEWKNKFPQTRILAREKDFEFFWDSEKKNLAKEGQWKIRGRIDRIDEDQQSRLVLIDYKLSPGDYKNHSKWLEKNQLQLALYMLALEEDVIAGLETKEVIGAFYYVLKNMDRNRGLKVDQAAGTLFDLDKKANRISEEKKAELLQAVKGIIQDVIGKIQEGRFNPAPLEPEKCGECSWKNLCRAPHLN